MTVIRPNSVSGITSITAQANEINVFRSNGTLAGLNLNGVNFNTTAGISTLAALKVTGNVDVAGVLTYQDVTNVDSLGIGTFRTGINVSGGQLDVGSNIKIGNAGVITATSFVGSGANLTSLPAQATIANNADNRVITGGSGVNLNGEQRLTWDGAQLYIDNQNYEPPILINSTQSSVRATIRQTNDANANSGLAIQKRHSSLHPANYWYGDISFEGWDGSGYHRAGLIECVAEGTPANDNMPGGLRFSTNPGAASQIERLRIKPDGNVEVKTGNLVISTAGKGIDFSATSDAGGMSSELLDNYEEGSYSPTMTGSGGGSFGMNPHALRYTKVGRVVHVSGRLYIHSSSGLSGSEVRMTLPYANSSAISSNDAHSYSYVTTYNAYNPNSDYQMVFSVIPGNSYGVFLWVVPNAVWQSVSPTSHMNQNAAYYGFNFTYTTAT